MDTTDKVLIGASTVIAVSALTMYVMSHKYDVMTKEVIGKMTEINYTLSRSREDIIKGNKAINEGNEMLKEMFKQNSNITSKLVEMNCNTSDKKQCDATVSTKSSNKKSENVKVIANDK